MPGSEEILSGDALTKYADAIVEAGVVVRRGDLLAIRCQPAHRELVLAVTEAAYRHGARHVEVEVNDPLVAAARFRHGGKGAIGVRAPWEPRRARALMEPDAALLQISGEASPDAYRGIDPQRLAADQQAARKLVSWFVTAVRESRVRWAIAAWPTEPWATRVYPELGALEAQRRLADDLLSFCRLTDGGGTAGWVAHARELERRARQLTRLSLERLLLRGPGTDLEIGLVRGASWLGGRERTASGRVTSPNMPTEEIFTSPAPGATRGIFRCSRPLVFRGTTIEGIGGEFERGRLVRIDAEENEHRELLTAVLDSDRNARRLGEIALVDASSRIGRAGRTYFDTLSTRMQPPISRSAVASRTLVRPACRA